VQSTILPQRVEINEAFRIRRENELPRVAALGHMVRDVQSDDACESSHEQKVPQSHEAGNVPSVPGSECYETSGSECLMTPAFSKTGKVALQWRRLHERARRSTPNADEYPKTASTQEPGLLQTR
jgi:hypothetical protein